MYIFKSASGTMRTVYLIETLELLLMEANQKAEFHSIAFGEIEAYTKLISALKEDEKSARTYQPSSFNVV
jgi:hypothetical protein